MISLQKQITALRIKEEQARIRFEEAKKVLLDIKKKIRELEHLINPPAN